MKLDVKAEVSLPLCPADRQAAATLNRALERAGFTERSLCERLTLPTLDSVDLPLFKSFVGRLAGAGLLEVLARVFLFGETVDGATLRDYLSADELDAFLTCDLIRVWDGSPSTAERFYSPVRLVPIDRSPDSSSDLLLVGDRADNPDGSSFTPFRDIVFSGHNPLTRQFLRLLPRTPCGDVLDLCAGTGVAALAMGPFADRCTAVDIAERSVHFAHFNSWLNLRPHDEVMCGNLYEPLKGRRFDRILAHPPYVPALTHKFTYRDGGRTGDEIVQGVIAGVPEHLNEHGTFHVLCLGMDTAEAAFEDRARAWLGEAGRQFDIVFALDSRTPPELIATRLVDRAGGTPQDLEQWRALFQGLRVKDFVYGALVGRRFTSRADGEPFTRRVLLTDESTAQGFEWLFQWFDWLREPDRHSRVLALTPTLAAGVHLEVRHGVRNHTFAPIGYALSNGGKPFHSRLETEAWVVAMLGELDGAISVREVFQSARSRARVPADFTEADLVRLMCFLLERGCLDVGASVAATLRL